jgi:glycerol uptake facilitator-like aquaporin
MMPDTTPSLRDRLTAEFMGTAILLMAVVGSGIMAAKLSGGNIGVALLANALATVAALWVLITALGPLSGAHFNPAVTAVMAARGEHPLREVAPYFVAQIAGAVLGVWLAHTMFDLAVLQVSTTVRASTGQFISEIVATSGLLATILMVRRSRPDAIAVAVALFVGSAYWFTASTSFANPAVTLARALTDTFAGITPASVPAFWLAQAIGAAIAFFGLRRI